MGTDLASYIAPNNGAGVRCGVVACGVMMKLNNAVLVGGVAILAAAGSINASASLTILPYPNPPGGTSGPIPGDCPPALPPPAGSTANYCEGVHESSGGYLPVIGVAGSTQSMWGWEWGQLFLEGDGSPASVTFDWFGSGNAALRNYFCVLGGPDGYECFDNQTSPTPPGTYVYPAPPIASFTLELATNTYVPFWYTNIGLYAGPLCNSPQMSPPTVPGQRPGPCQPNPYSTTVPAGAPEEAAHYWLSDGTLGSSLQTPPDGFDSRLHTTSLRSVWIGFTDGNGRQPDDDEQDGTVRVTVPEPGSLALLSLCLAGLGALRRRNRS